MRCTWKACRSSSTRTRQTGRVVCAHSWQRCICALSSCRQTLVTLMRSWKYCKGVIRHVNSLKSGALQAFDSIHLDRLPMTSYFTLNRSLCKQGLVQRCADRSGSGSGPPPRDTCSERTETHQSRSSQTPNQQTLKTQIQDHEAKPEIVFTALVRWAGLRAASGKDTSGVMLLALSLAR